MIDDIKTDNNKTPKGRFVRDAYLISAIIVAIIILMGSIISPFVWKKSIDLKVNYNAKEINIIRNDVEKLKGIDIQVKDMNTKINGIYDFLLKTRGSK